MESPMNIPNLLWYIHKSDHGPDFFPELSTIFIEIPYFMYTAIKFELLGFKSPLRFLTLTERWQDDWFDTQLTPTVFNSTNTSDYIGLGP